MTLPGRLSLFSALLLLMLVFEAHTDVVSWVDENGVRHYSNVGGSGSSSDVKKMEEYKSNPSDKGYRQKRRDEFKVLKMYKEDKKTEREKKLKEYNIKAKKKAEERAKAKKEKAIRDCEQLGLELKKLREKGWKNYPYNPGVSCPGESWGGWNGSVYHDMVVCTALRNEAKQRAYQRALRDKIRRLEYICRESSK